MTTPCSDCTSAWLSAWGDQLVTFHPDCLLAISWAQRSRYRPEGEEPEEERAVAAAARHYLWALTAGRADVCGAKTALAQALAEREEK